MSESSPTRILLVEDSPPDRRLIVALLTEGEPFPVVLEEVSRLSEALTRAAKGGIDAVLLDLNLPDSMALETFTKLHAAVPHIPVVVLTGLEDHELATRAVREGAQDFLSKGQIDGATIWRSIQYAIERIERCRVQKKLERMSLEFDAARRIQEHLLPTVTPELSGFDIAGACRPTEATGGDFFDYIPMPNGNLGIVVADVSSHGFAPALIMAGTRRVLRTLAATQTNLSSMLEITNRSVLEDTQSDHFVTLFFALLDPRTQTLNYSGAGHEAYLIKQSGKTSKLESTSLPLGMAPETAFKCAEPIALETGQLLLLLTDGFQEAVATDGSMYGVARVLNLVCEHRFKPAREIIDVLFDDVKNFCHPHVHQDDVTAVVVKVGGDRGIKRG